MKLTSPLGGIQQAGAAEAAAKSVTAWFYLQLVLSYKWLDTTFYFIITNFHTELPQVKVSHDTNP